MNKKKSKAGVADADRAGSKRHEGHKASLTAAPATPAAAPTMTGGLDEVVYYDSDAGDETPATQTAPGVPPVPRSRPTAELDITAQELGQTDPVSSSAEAGTPKSGGGGFTTAMKYSRIPKFQGDADVDRMGFATWFQNYVMTQAGVTTDTQRRLFASHHLTGEAAASSQSILRPDGASDEQFDRYWLQDMEAAFSGPSYTDHVSAWDKLSLAPGQTAHAYRRAVMELSKSVPGPDSIREPGMYNAFLVGRLVTGLPATLKEHVETSLHVSNDDMCSNIHEVVRTLSSKMTVMGRAAVDAAIAQATTGPYRIPRVAPIVGHVGGTNANVATQSATGAVCRTPFCGGNHPQSHCRYWLVTRQLKQAILFIEKESQKGLSGIYKTGNLARPPRSLNRGPDSSSQVAKKLLAQVNAVAAQIETLSKNA
jgi:hypothetical protein